MDNNLENIPVDVLLEIIQDLPGKEVLRLCRVSSYFNEVICQKNLGNIWDKLYRRDIDPIVPKNPREEYSRIMEEYENIEKRETRKTRIYRLLEFAVKNGYHQMIENVLSKYPEKVLPTAGYAARYKQRDILEEMINRLQPLKQGVLNRLLVAATHGGSLDTIEFLSNIARKAKLRVDPNLILKWASRYGHRNIIDKMINRYGANQFNRAAELAASGGYEDIMREMINRQMNAGGIVDIEPDLMYAAQGGHSNLVNILIDEFGATNLDQAIMAAAREGHLDIVRELIRRAKENGIDIDSYNYLNSAVSGCHLNVFNEFIDQYGVGKLSFLINLLPTAAEFGCLDVFLELVKRIRQYNGGNFPWDWKEEDLEESIVTFKDILELSLQRAASRDEYEIVEELLDHPDIYGKLNVDLALGEAAKKGNLELVLELINKYGATAIVYAMKEAVGGGHLRVFRQLHQYLNLDDKVPRYGDMLNVAAIKGDLNFVKDILSRVEFPDNIINDLILDAANEGKIQVADYLRDYLNQRKNQD